MNLLQLRLHVCGTHLRRCEPGCMPGLWLLAPGSWVLWLLLSEQTLPDQKGHHPLFSQLVPVRKHWRHRPAETKRRRKQAHLMFVQLCHRRDDFGHRMCVTGSLVDLGLAEIGVKNHP